MENFLEVTEANMMTAMRKINDFLTEAQTKQYLGRCVTVVDPQEEGSETGTTKKPVRKTVLLYLPFVGNCSVHSVREEVATKVRYGDEVPLDEMERYHQNLLAINGDYKSSCFPITAGSKIWFGKSAMKISRYNRISDSYSDLVFVHKDLTDADKQHLVKEGIFSMFDLALNGCLNYFDVEDCFGKAVTDLYVKLSNDIFTFIESIDINQPTVEHDFEVRHALLDKPERLTLHIDIDQVRDGITNRDDSTFYFKHGVDTFGDLFTAIESGIFRDLINEETFKD